MPSTSTVAAASDSESEADKQLVGDALLAAEGVAEDDWDLLSIKDTAAKLSVKPWFVYQLVGDGVLPSVYLGRQTRRIRRADLRAYIEGLPTERPAKGS